MTLNGIWTIDNKKDVKLLRKKVADFDFKKYSRKDIQELLKKMREAMKKANGVGLSANQIGLDLKVFIAQVEGKFYAVFNPGLTKVSEEKLGMEEGCLSVPEIFGSVERPARVTLEGWDKNGKKLKIKAWGLLARVFQHEVDHLNGGIFIDKATDLHRYEKTEEHKNKET
ncbi:MAG: peptide deformylase [Candidatus Harrisonbacteria bacterium]|nr:peptide deformylase [Candidatus Harrisonbacteria bacterium]